MLQGLYKFEIETGRAAAAAASLFATPDGKLYGGNSSSSLVGSYTEKDGVYASELIDAAAQRRSEGYVPNYPTDNILSGVHWVRFAANELHVPKADAPSPAGIAFKAIMTPINDADAPPPGKVGPDGIGNGLYSIHIRMLDGLDGGNTGVMLLQDGNIRGGDAFFDYIGAYSSANGRWKGEIVNHEHTPSLGERPVFGGHEVGIGFSGTYDDEGADGEATALAGKRSIRFKGGVAQEAGQSDKRRTKPVRSPAAARR